MPQYPIGRFDVEGRAGTALAGAAAPVDWCSPKIGRVDRLYGYWQSRCQGRAVPLRRDIEPQDIKDLLPYLIIAELHQDPLRVRYRLGGAAVNEAMGYNIAGHWLHEMDVAGGHEAWIGFYRRMAETQRPVFGRSVGTLSNVIMFSCNFALLPVSQNGEAIDQCLEIENWEAERGSAQFNDSNMEWAVSLLP
ncbi:MAG TPA: PAS domain-containing protein [Dongiaceae bacterium]